MVPNPPPAPVTDDALCPSCGGKRPDEFCPACGERRVNPREFGILYFLGQAIGGITTLDGKILGSLRALVFRPGELTRGWLRGARVRRMKPVQLFLLVNVVVLFAAQLWELTSFGSSSAAEAISKWKLVMQSQAAELGMEYSDYKKLFAAKSSTIARSSVIVLVPIAALLSLAFNFMRERRFGAHLAFGAHAIAFFLLVPDLLLMSLLSPLVRPMIDTLPEPKSELAIWGVTLLPFFVFGTWWSIASRRAFGTHKAIAAFQLVVIPIAFIFVGLIGYQYLIFKLTIQALAE